MSRRRAIFLMGGGVVLAAAAGAGGFLTTRTPTTAIAPWGAAGTYTEPRKRALSYAILAPNPHNRQPWVAEMRGDTGLAIWRDKTRNIPETDPFDRQLTIGMGCFLELLRMAGAEDGWRTDTTLFPEGEDGPVALIDFAAGGVADPLFAHVPDRHTNRNPYDDRPVDAQAVDALQQYATLVTEPDAVSDLRELTVEAMNIEMTTPHTFRESADLIRLGKAEIQANPDGISLGGPFLESLMLVGLLTREGMADPDSAQFQQGLDMQKTSLTATPAYAVITSPGNTRHDQIGAGAAWLRLHLAATGQGLAMQPASQALQEYHEMATLYTKVHDMLAAPGETVQMLGRLGYCQPVGPSPRWPLESCLKHA
ncbi:MAG: twin-arginine translocation pathway signal protein [Rhodobacteraceae bacterium]|nr:twin-arginine translocation pathway signal protein [Paracoccaceae bacterium]